MVDSPFRIDLFDLEVDSIRIFDPETQRTNEKIDQISMLPAREFPIDDAGVADRDWHPRGVRDFDRADGRSASRSDARCRGAAE